MKVRINKEVIKRLPDIKIGLLVIHGIDLNQEGHKMAQKLEKSIKELVAKYKGQDVNQINEIKRWHENLEKVGIDSMLHPVSIQAMLDRIIVQGKELNSINPLVDLYNSISLSTLTPMGAYNLDNIHGDLELKFASGGETYHPLNGKKAEKTDKGELIFIDEEEALCRYWVNKQSKTHKIQDHVSNIIFRIEGITKDPVELEEIMNLLEKEIHENFHPEKIEMHTLNANDNEVEFDKPEQNEKEKLIQNILTRGVSEIIVEEDLAKKLRMAAKNGTQLRIKFGIDPTGADLHIGHMVVIKKLKEFQELGHHIMLLFGNFTGQLGDPTGKIETRKSKTQEELEKNAKHYLKQAGKILDIKKVEVVWNADWLSKMSFADVLKLASAFTVAQMMERDMFQDRVKNEYPIGVQEFMYPLMQGYDSVALKADVELGGTDQTFNLLAGRQIQEAYGQEPQNILTVPILEGLDGKLKMGKSTENYIGVNDEPNDMYGKTMSIPDEMIIRYFELATDLPIEEILQIKLQISEGANPRDIKMRLAREIVTYYHDTNAALNAEKAFIKQFREGENPEEMPEISINNIKQSSGIAEALHIAQLVDSKSEARRMVDSGAVKINGEKIENIETKIEFKKGDIIQVGKRRFAKII